MPEADVVGWGDQLGAALGEVERAAVEFLEVWRDAGAHPGAVAVAFADLGVAVGRAQGILQAAGRPA
jgi:hypothetical protein